MEKQINGLNIHYIDEGTGKPILLLHGWGACIDSFAPVTAALSKERRVVALDFPGFGQSDTPQASMDVEAYAECTAEFIRVLDLGQPDIICHSFGGRVTILLAAKYPKLVGKIVFVGAARA